MNAARRMWVLFEPIHGLGPQDRRATSHSTSARTAPIAISSGQPTPNMARPYDRMYGDLPAGWSGAAPRCYSVRPLGSRPPVEGVFAGGELGHVVARVVGFGVVPGADHDRVA